MTVGNIVENSTYRYAELADRWEAQIRNGSFRAGEKMPSIRTVHRETGLSITTVYHAFVELEKRGLVSARRKSGYFVNPLVENLLPAPRSAKPVLKPHKLTVNNLASTLCEAMLDSDVVQLGGAVISPELLPLRELTAMLKSSSVKELRSCLSNYDHYLGCKALRRQVTQRMAHLIGGIPPDAVVITNGCIEAVSLCLRAVASHGDTIVVESPTFPWFLQIIEDFGMFALEIPSHAETGIDMGLLKEAIEHHPVRACLLNSNFSNPLGSLLSDEKKSELVHLLTDREIPIIEDDIYGELFFGDARPSPLKRFDQKGLVLHCSSISKSLSPGLRVGWALPGKYLEKVRRLKLNHAISQPSLPQMVASRYLSRGLFDRHLRKLRTCLKNQVGNTALAVSRWFPNGTKISAPKGGVTLWVQLPAEIDSLALFKKALSKKIAVLPGIICAGTPAYNNCIRISCGLPYTAQTDRSIQQLAAIVRSMM